MDERPPSANVRSEGPATVVAIPKALLQAKLDKDRDFASHFFKGVAVALSDRLRIAHGQERARAGELDEDLDELNPELLRTMHLAGARFQRLAAAALGRK